MSGLEKIEKELTDILIKVAEVQKINQYELFVNTNSTMTEGFLSDFYTGVIKNKDTKHTTSVAMKLIPKKGGIFQEYGVLYKNEDNVYSKIFPALDSFQDEKKVQKRFNNIPNYFCGSIESGKEYIAMQNIKDLGYLLLDKQKWFDEKYLNLIFETFGKFHALSFAFRDQYLNEYNDVLKTLTDVLGGITESDAILKAVENNVLSGFKVFDQPNDTDIITKLKNIGDIKRFVLNGMKYKGLYKCIIHGDCWSNNMLFKYKDSGVLENMKFIDFQLTKESTPVHDLIFFFYSGASEKDFKKLDTYLEKYYESFSNFAKELGSDPNKLYPYEVLKTEWRENAVVGAFFGIDLLVPQLMDNKDILELRTKEASKEERHEMWETEMEKVRKSDTFKDKARHIILHLVEYGFL